MMKKRWLGTLALLVLTPAHAADSAAKATKAVTLAKQNSCFSCHAKDKKLVGPAFQDVAQRYKNNALAKKQLIQKIKIGGAGQWGVIPMPAHPNLNAEELKILAEWVLAGANGSPQ